MEIKVLAPEIVDQIAAGEVVERPAHLVKELVENSLDAGSTQIEIDVDQGGRKIKVSDNGRGIYRDDLPLVCARHATSKITDADDLWKLHTFGFRGEALASISSVSRLKIVSKRKDGDAFAYENNYGKSGSALKTGGSEGTVIEVEDLFSNVPARLKFLKSDAAEVAQIKNVIKALALAHPAVEFKFKQQGKVILFYPREKDLKARAEKVLETSDLFHVNKEFQNFKLEMVYGSPNNTTGTSKQIWIFVQNRWVQDRSIQAAVMESYRSLLMHGEYPYAVLKLQIPDGQVDVNIHPTKSQVKFMDQSTVFRFVHSSLRSELEMAPWLGGMNKGSPPPSQQAQSAYENLSFSDTAMSTTRFQKKSFAPEASSENFPTMNDLRTAASVAPTAAAFDPHEEESNTFWSRLQVQGQVHLTYILAEGENSLFLVDQHAAHERVVFERLMEGWKNGSFEIQNYLLPLSLNLGAEQVEAFLGLKDEVQKLGVYIEQAGPETLLITGAPNFISEKALVTSLEKFANDLLQHGGSFSFEKKVGDIFATMACHSVVRAGQALSVEEMRSLLRQMDEFRLSSYCPHGRNVFVEMPFTQIERDFGRIP